MKLLLLFFLMLPSVFAVEVPLFLSVGASLDVETAKMMIEEQTYEENVPEIQELAVTGAVAYDDSSSNKNWALWLILGVAGVIAAILVLRR